MLEVFHQPLHVSQLSIQLDFVIVDHIKLSAQVGHISLKHGLDVRPAWGLTLQNVPFGLQNLVLLLQEPHLRIPTQTIVTIVIFEARFIFSLFFLGVECALEIGRDPK